MVGKIKGLCNRYTVIFSFFLAISFMLMLKVHVVDNDIQLGIESNYFKDFAYTDILIAIAAFVVLIPLCYLLRKGINKASVYIIRNDGKLVNKRRFLLIWAAIIVVFWTLLLLSYFPGGVMSDTQWSISYYYDGISTNRFPFLYSWCLGRIIAFSEWLGYGLYEGMIIASVVQSLLMMALVIYSCNWLLDRKVNVIIINVIMSFLVIFPACSTYTISIWKDTPFVMGFLFWYIKFVDLYNEMVEKNVKRKTVILFCLGIFMVAFTRNNGKYLLLAFLLFLFLVNIKLKYKDKLKVLLPTIASVVIVFVIQGPIYERILDSQVGITEQIGIPMQQVGAVVVYDGEMTASEYEDIGYYIPHNGIIEKFTPLCVDNLKWYSGINYEYLNANKMNFIKLWVKLGLKNPVRYVKEYLLQTCGFWDIFVGYEPAASYHTSNFFYYEELPQHDYIEETIGISLRPIIEAGSKANGAILFWIFLGFGFWMMDVYGWRNFILVMPQISLWLTLMIATPWAICFRYISPLLFTLPVLLILPGILSEKGKGLQNE